MEIYTDADYAGSVVDRRSTFKYCMSLGGNLVTWRARFRAMTHGICKGLWMKIILDDLKYCHNPIQRDRTKHIEIGRHFTKEKLNSGFVVTTHVPTGLQVVDVFTKGLPTTKFQELNGKLGMIDIHLTT
ncbi:Copia protein, partial [Mucuna pruriens]